MSSMFANRMAGIVLFLAAALMMGGIAGADDLVNAPAFPQLKFSASNIVNLPPGRIEGKAARPDGVTPYANMKIALVSPDTGEELISTLTGEDGRFVFEETPQGRYIVMVGNPGIVAIIEVAPGTAPGFLNIIVPKAMSLPVPDWAPEWAHNSPALGYATAGLGGLVIIAGGYFAYDSYIADDDKDEAAPRRPRMEISPIIPQTR